MVLLLSNSVIRISNTGPQKTTFLTQHSHCQTLQKALKQQKKNHLEPVFEYGKTRSSSSMHPRLEEGMSGMGSSFSN